MIFEGVHITVSRHAVQRTENWPVKRRSRRLHKKLTKLRGPQFTDEPCIIRMPSGDIIMHPSFYHKLRAVGGDA